jgi:hypothetical protein
LDVAYTLRVDEAAGHDRGLLMAMAARDHVDSDGLDEIAQSLAADGSVAQFERALVEVDLGPEPEAPDVPDEEAVMATITSLQAFAQAANNRPIV